MVGVYAAFGHCVAVLLCHSSFLMSVCICSVVDVKQCEYVVCRFA